MLKKPKKCLLCKVNYFTAGNYPFLQIIRNHSFLKQAEKQGTIYCVERKNLSLVYIYIKCMCFVIFTKNKQIFSLSKAGTDSGIIKPEGHSGRFCGSDQPDIGEKMLVSADIITPFF